MRDMLFVIEDQPRDIDVNKVLFDKKLEKYTNKNELCYTLEKMIEAGLLDGKPYPSKTKTVLLISSITVDGHKFIENVRQDTAWNKIKQTISKNGITTIGSLIPVVFEAIKTGL